ncbi:MAG: hypothetical protein K9K76_11395 [Halanaerobiales bacterium]|nr:hypothetical protein [Halanaerobiales bacterium]
MSKKEVLEQVYPDELEYIFEKKKEKELKRYMGYMNQIMAVTAGFGGGDAAKEYVENIKEAIEELSDNKKKEESSNINDWYSEYKKLQNKENRTAEEQRRINRLKDKMDNHIDNEINKLKGLHTKQKQINEQQ